MTGAELHPEIQSMVNPATVTAALLTLLPLLIAAFLPQALLRTRRMPLVVRLMSPAALAVPYLLVTLASGGFRWGWFALYCLLPVAIGGLLWRASRVDSSGQPEGQRGNWRDFVVIGVLGLAVDLRWFEAAWPPHMAIFSKMLLLDAGIYAFIVLRELEGVGFDLRLRWNDLGIGLREAALYTPVALALGLSLGFLHVHAAWPGFAAIPIAWIFTFLFIAVPEELFFRGWLQNLLEKRLGRYPALLVTALLFGLAHFNKRTAFFNWRYVVLAALAGIFYGRAWRRQRRVGASAVTHATVDSIWSLWFR